MLDTKLLSIDTVALKCDVNSITKKSLEEYIPCLDFKIPNPTSPYQPLFFITLIRTLYTNKILVHTTVSDITNTSIDRVFGSETNGNTDIFKHETPLYIASLFLKRCFNTREVKVAQALSHSHYFPIGFYYPNIKFPKCFPMYLSTVYLEDSDFDVLNSNLLTGSRFISAEEVTMDLCENLPEIYNHIKYTILKKEK